MHFFKQLSKFFISAFPYAQNVIKTYDQYMKHIGSTTFQIVGEPLSDLGYPLHPENVSTE